MRDKRMYAIFRIAEALRGKPNGRALVMALRSDYLRHVVMDEMMTNFADEFSRANVTRFEVGHKDGGVVLLMTYDQLKRLQGYRFEIAVLEGELPFGRGRQIRDEVHTVMVSQESPVLHTRGLILLPQEECPLCGAHFGQHYVGCNDFPKAWPYHAVHYDGASHPVAVFSVKDQAERYGREHAGGARLEVRPMRLRVEKEGTPPSLGEAWRPMAELVAKGYSPSLKPDWHGSWMVLVNMKSDFVFQTGWYPTPEDAIRAAHFNAVERKLYEGASCSEDYGYCNVHGYH